MPDLRKKETSLRADLQALESRITEQETYLKLAENLDSFLARLRVFSPIPCWAHLPPEVYRARVKTLVEVDSPSRAPVRGHR